MHALLTNLFGPSSVVGLLVRQGRFQLSHLRQASVKPQLSLFNHVTYQSVTRRTLTLLAALRLRRDVKGQYPRKMVYWCEGWPIDILVGLTKYVGATSSSNKELR